jgi:hypothetical protein
MEVPVKGTKMLLAVAGLAAALMPAVASGQPAGQKSRCFYITQFETWRAPDPHTMYLRISTNRFYRVDMASACPQLTWPGSHLVTTWRTSGLVCTAMDWDLKVSTGVSGFASPCIVKSMTELSPEEAAQIPPKYKP